MGSENQIFVDNGDGTVTDTKTGLTWQKGDAGPMRWEHAVETCKNLSLAGKSDWRLPTLEELKRLFRSLSDDEHVLDRRFEPFEWSGQWYWTSKVVDPYYAAYLVNFRGGALPWQTKNETFYVRAVRSPSDK